MNVFSRNGRLKAIALLLSLLLWSIFHYNRSKEQAAQRAQRAKSRKPAAAKAVKPAPPVVP